MGVIDKFVEAYERQYDYWDNVAQRAQTLVENELGRSGLRAIATSRAKSVERLREKLLQRHRLRKYRSTTEIAADIVDLAGVRIALYFPSQIDEVEQIIRSLFDVEKVKEFPIMGAERPGAPRFSGYRAKHFRVRIPRHRLTDNEERYGSALVEIQVASVLMHAWSEVEHDLVYKPLEGSLSGAEYALLDQLNGLVLAGEVALEQLKVAADQRISAAETPFRDHYELAEFLRSQPTTRDQLLSDAALGNVEVLFEFLRSQDRATAGEVAPLVARLDGDFEARPVADQISDLLLSDDPSLYPAHHRAMSRTRHPSRRSQAEPGRAGPDLEAVGQFVLLWAELDHELGNLVGTRERTPYARLQLAREVGILDDASFTRALSLRQLRNELVHGGPSSGATRAITGAELELAVDTAKQLLEQLRER